MGILNSSSIATGETDESAIKRRCRGKFGKWKIFSGTVREHFICFRLIGPRSNIPFLFSPLKKVAYHDDPTQWRSNAAKISQTDRRQLSDLSSDRGDEFKPLCNRQQQSPCRVRRRAANLRRLH